jgi:predicted lipoprotein with Yx(FWY)xxD motif
MAAAALGAVVLTGASAAQASPTQVDTAGSTKVVVVKVANRSPFGNILTNTKGLSLYIHPGGPCTAGCLQVWPPLKMPTGKTIPEGAKCLSTVKFGAHGLQVTYQKQALFTFVQDKGTSVNGNGVGGFMVAKVSASCP